MAVWTYETIDSPIPNATVEKGYADGVHKIYRISPLSGYVLHDTQYDGVNYENQIDEETGETIVAEIPYLGYHSYRVTCAASYAFTPIQMLDEEGDTVTAYGDRKFYCKPATDVPADQIFGVVDTPAVM
jgi:hypothetical protein